MILTKEDIEHLKSKAELASFDMTEKGYRSSAKISEFNIAFTPATSVALCDLALATITALSTQPSVADEVKVLREALKNLTAFYAWHVLNHEGYRDKASGLHKLTVFEQARAALASVKE